MSTRHKPPIFIDNPAAKQLRRLSKAALIDVVIDAAKRMHGETTYEEYPRACLDDVCAVPLRHRGDRNPWADTCADYTPQT